MPSPEFKPCPFCGAVGRDLELRTCTTERSGVWTWYNADVHCRVCRVVVCGRDTTDKQEAVATAIAAWNRRYDGKDNVKEAANDPH